MNKNSSEAGKDTETLPQSRCYLKDISLNGCVGQLSSQKKIFSMQIHSANLKPDGPNGPSRFDTYEIMDSGEVYLLLQILD